MSTARIARGRRTQRVLAAYLAAHGWPHAASKGAAERVTGDGPVETGIRAVLDHLEREDWGPHTIRVTLDNNGRFTPTEQP